MCHCTDKIIIWLIGSSFLLALIPICFYIYKFHGGFSNSQDTWGQFGDFIGGTINPIFALLSFSALLYTVILQRREINTALAQIEKSEQFKKQEDIAQVLKLVDSSLEAKYQTLVSRRFKVPVRTEKEYRLPKELAKDINLLHKHLLELLANDPDSALVDYFRHKYKDIVALLIKTKYLDKDTENIFTTSDHGNS